MGLNYLTEVRHTYMENRAVYRVILTTRGRKSGRPHSVILRAVKYNDKFYFSRHKPDGDWFQNAIINPYVEIEFDGKKIKGSAKEVSDERLGQKISELKYPSEERAKEKRVIIEVTQYG